MTEATKAGRWFRLRSFVDRHAMVIALLLVVGVAVGAVVGVRWEARERDEAIELTNTNALAADAKQAAERRSQICAESRNLRALVSELIDTAVGEPSGVRFDSVPSFDALPASVQQFLRDYAAASAAGASGPDLAERLRAFQESRLSELPEFCT